MGVPGSAARSRGELKGLGSGGRLRGKPESKCGGSRGRRHGSSV